MEQYYRIYLWDYATPSFVSCDKPYFGTLEDIRGFMAALAADERHGNSFSDLIAAFREYEAGNHRVTHNVAYHDSLLLEPMTVIGSANHQMDGYSWEYINTWNCPYHIRSGHMEMTNIWLAGPDGTCYRAMKARISDMEYRGTNDDWTPLLGGFWGHPMILQVDGTTVWNCLAEQVKVFDSRKEARRDMVQFQMARDVDLDEFCGDIFGDG